jgi:hypothetical protein
MPFDLQNDEEQQDQIVNGFRLPMPKAAAAPATTATAEPVTSTPSEGMRVASLPQGIDQQPGFNAVKDVLRTSDARMPPTPPANPALPDLIRQRAQTGDPLDRKAIDPATGKPKYRMGFGQRLLGTFANAATGFAKPGSAPVVDVGPGALNNNFYRDEAMREGKVANLDQQITNQQKLDESNRKQFDSATKQAYETQVGNARQETAAAQRDSAAARQTAADAQQQKADTDQKLKENKINPIDTRIGEADKMGLKGTDRKFFLANGKLPEPKEKSDRQPSELETWSAAFKRQYGRDPNADEIALRHHVGGTGSFKDAAAVDKYSDTYYRQERAKVETQKKNWAALNKDASEEEQQAAYKAIEDEYKNRSDEFEERKKGYYDQVGNKGGTPSASSSKPPAAPASSPKAYKFTTKPNAQGVRLGSDDGQNWVDVTTGKPFAKR